MRSTLSHIYTIAVDHCMLHNRVVSEIQIFAAMQYDKSVLTLLARIFKDYRFNCLKSVHGLWSASDVEKGLK